MIASYNIHYKAVVFPAFGRGRRGFLVGQACTVLSASAVVTCALRPCARCEATGAIHSLSGVAQPLQAKSFLIPVIHRFKAVNRYVYIQNILFPEGKIILRVTLTLLQITLFARLRINVNNALASR
ncbi:hypothetical protein [Siccibacter colletis]|uniref:hypothetical protein n=1 Tax=Siccibacter colletis TaxID=1505757 RepID=UPI003CED56A6